MWWSQIITLFVSSLTDSPLFLWSGSVLITTFSMKWFLQPNQVAQVVQLLLDGAFMYAVRQRFIASPGAVSKWGELEGAVAGPVSAPLWKEEQEEHFQSPKNDHQCSTKLSAPCGWHEGFTSFSGTCTHSPTLCSSVYKNTRSDRPAIRAPFSQITAGSHRAHVTGPKESRDAAMSVPLIVLSIVSLFNSIWISIDFTCTEVTFQCESSSNSCVFIVPPRG